MYVHTYHGAQSRTPHRTLSCRSVVEAARLDRKLMNLKRSDYKSTVKAAMSKEA